MNRLTLTLLLLLSPLGLRAQGSLTPLQVDSLSRMHYAGIMQIYAQQIEPSWQSGVLKSGNYQMPFVYSVNGAKPEQGYPLYISLHGGGEGSAESNDQQWENQKTLYGAVEGIYFVPRAPTNTWNMWHQDYMDEFLRQVIAYSTAKLEVDISRVYLLGYSAGGDGVYNLATRLSDRFAAAAMMAGHPGDAQIENLRNLPFGIYVGANDTAYNRAGLAYEWAKAYEQLHKEDSGGFEYVVNIYGDKGHWMDGLDSEAISWLASRRRVSNPDRVIWIQDDVLSLYKYNLQVSSVAPGYRIEERIDRNNNAIHLDSDHYSEVTIWLDDFIVNLDLPVKVYFNNTKVFEGMVARTEQNIIDSITINLDSEYLFWGKVTVQKAK